MPSGVSAGGGAFICRSSASMTAAWRSITLRALAASPASFWRSRSFSLPRRRASVSISRSRVSMVPILASERRVQTFSAMSGPASSASIPPWTASCPPPPAVSHTASTTSTTAAMTENSTSCRRRTAPASPSTAAPVPEPGALTAGCVGRHCVGRHCVGRHCVARHCVGRNRVGRAGGVGHDHRETAARGAAAGRRQPRRRRPDTHGPGEVRGIGHRAVAFDDMRREPRPSPGLDDRQAADDPPGPGLDRVSRRRLAPRHRADQPDQRRHPGPAPDADPGIGPGGRGTAASTLPPGPAAAPLRIRICAESRSDGVSVSR